MTPEEFYKRDRLIKYTHQTVKEMRVRSLDWMLGCFRKGTIRRRTIVNLIPLADLYYLLKDMERLKDTKIVNNQISNRRNIRTKIRTK